MMAVLRRLAKRLLMMTGHTLVPRAAIIATARQLRSFHHISRRFETVESVPGNIVECGVGKGRTFLYLCFLAVQEKKNRHVWGFDSFEGFPEPHAQDASDRNPKKGEWSDTSVALIYSILKSAGIPGAWIADHVTLVPGFFNASLLQYSGEPIALLHIDVDLYESYKDCLQTLYQFVSPGGVVLFDEYNQEKWPGATRAIDEFFVAHHQEVVLDEKSGKYYVIKQ